jgi:hypothetical protein
MTVRRPYVAIVTSVAVALLGSWLGIRFYGATQAWPATLSDREFWDMVVSFSEPGQAFRSWWAVRTDNLISNEQSFQQVIPGLQNAAHRGAYIGVGPEQNFTYITALKPTIAFIIDIRRENMLLHLMYKALAELSTDRVEFLSYLFARPRPTGLGTDSTAQALLDAFRPAPCSEKLANANLRTVFDRLERVHGFTLSRGDESHIKDANEAFCAGGPDIRWDSSGDSWIPSYADLMVETDPRGRHDSFLASEELFRILKRYETANRIVPVVGDFGGDRAIRAVGRYLKNHDATVATFYTSNVEGYLRDDGPTKFIANVSALPLDEHSTFIRTIFKTVGYAQTRPEYETSTVTDSIIGWVNAFKTRERR